MTGDNWLPGVDWAYRLLCDLLSGTAEETEWKGLTSPGWDFLLCTAEAEGVAPLVYWLLQELGWSEWVPQCAVAALASSYYDTAACNALLYGELARILRLLHAANVPVVVLKGALLAATYYPDPALRPMADLDLLVHRDDVADAVELCRSCGYEAIEFYPGFSLEFGHHIHLVSRDRVGAAVEIHWNLVAGEADSLAPPEPWSWERTVEWSVGPSPDEAHGRCSALALAEEMHFLYLVAHLLLQHAASQERLIWWYDLHLIVQAAGDLADWDCAAVRARDFGWLGALEAATTGLAQRFATLLPAGLLSALAALWSDRSALARSPRGRKLGVLGVFPALDWRARLRLLRGVVLPQRSFVRWYYNPRPSWLWPAYYLRRWLEVIQDTRRALVHR